MYNQNDGAIDGQNKYNAGLNHYDDANNEPQPSYNVYDL